MDGFHQTDQNRASMHHKLLRSFNENRMFDNLQVNKIVKFNAADDDAPRMMVRCQLAAARDHAGSNFCGHASRQIYQQTISHNK